MKPPFLSVVLPTYNRKYCITRMVDSILQQSFKDFELIIIDDGSTDGTFEMLKKRYQDKRIRLTRQENNGVSSARNLGISLAKGKYITFVDSDDYLLDGFFEDIFQKIQQFQCDTLVYGGYNLENGKQIEVPLFWKDKKYEKNEATIKSGEEFIKDFCLFGGNSWGCAKIFRTSKISNNVSFDTRITFGEDLLFNIQVYMISSEILTSSKKFYVCNNNTESLCRGLLTSVEKCKNLLLVYQTLKENTDYENYFALSILRHMIFWLWDTFYFFDKKEKEQIREMASLASLCECGKFEKIKFVLMTKSFFIAKTFFRIYTSIYFLYSKTTFSHK